MKVFKIQQFDLGGEQFGSRVSTMSLEAAVPTPLSSPSPSSSSVHVRKCLLLRAAASSTLRQLQQAVEQGVGGVLLLLPANLTSLTEEQSECVESVERYLLSRSFDMPVLITEETSQLSELYEQLSELSAARAASQSLTDMLLGVVASTGHQLDVTAAASSSSSSTASSNTQLHNIVGVLHGRGVSDQLASVVLVAHYDAMAAAPLLSQGADSNGSGVAVLLELARLFGRLYRQRSSHGRVNVHFLLSAGGQLNYAGSRRWLDNNAELLETSGGQGVQMVICLDSVASGYGINFHVSKPPRSGTPADKFYQTVKAMAQHDAEASSNATVPVNMVHKKINLADPTAAWEHEVFSLRRLSAFTLSHLQKADNGVRRSLLDTRQRRVNTAALAGHTRLLATALAQHVFQLDDWQTAAAIFTDHLEVSSDSLSMWLDLLTSSPRSPQLLTNPKQEPIVSISSHMRRELHKVEIVPFGSDRSDKHQPDWQLYQGGTSSSDQLQLLLSVQLVKPAAFELFVSVAVLLYLVLVFLVINSVLPQVYTAICHRTTAAAAAAAVKRHTD